MSPAITVPVTVLSPGVSASVLGASRLPDRSPSVASLQLDARASGADQQPSGKN